MNARVSAPGSSGACRASSARNSRPAFSSWADVAPGIRAQVRTQRRRGADPAEQGVHRAVPQHVHVIDAVRARGHPGDQARDLQVRVDAALAGRRDVLRDQLAEPGALRQGHHRDQPGVRHEIRVIERCVRLREAMQQSHLQGVLSNRELEASATPIIPGQRAPFTLTRPKHHQLTGGSRLSRMAGKPAQHNKPAWATTDPALGQRWRGERISSGRDRHPVTVRDRASHLRAVPDCRRRAGSVPMTANSLWNRVGSGNRWSRPITVLQPSLRVSHVVAGCKRRFFDPDGLPGPGLPGFGARRMSPHRLIGESEHEYARLCRRCLGQGRGRRCPRR